MLIGGGGFHLPVRTEASTEPPAPPPPPPPQEDEEAAPVRPVSHDTEAPAPAQPADTQGEAGERLEEAQAAVEAYREDPSEENEEAAGLALGRLREAAEHEMREAADGADDAEAALGDKHDELVERYAEAGLDETLATAVLDDGDQTAVERVLGESPQTRASEQAGYEFRLACEDLVALEEDDAASEADLAAARERVAEQYEAFREALGHELDMELATRHRDNPDAGAEALGQYEAAASGDGEVTEFTDAELEAALSALEENHPGLDLSGTLEPLGTEREIARALDDINPNDPSLTDAERELAREDPVTLAVLQVAGATLDPGDRSQPVEMRTLMDTDPIGYALVQLSGVDVDPDNPELSAQEQALAEESAVGFALTSVAEDNPEAYARIQHLLAGMAEVRLDYTTTRLDELMAGNPSQENEAAALEVLTANLDATTSKAERERLFEEAGLPHFSRTYFEGRLAEVTGEPDEDDIAAQNDPTLNADKAGTYMLSVSEHAPPEVANLLLDAMTSEFGEGWYDRAGGNATGLPGDWHSFAAGLTATVELADQPVFGERLDGEAGRAEEIAEWLADDSLYDGQSATLVHELRGASTGYGFESIRSAMSDGHGTRLADALEGVIAGSSDLDHFSDDFSFIVELGREEAAEHAGNEQAERDLAIWREDPERFLEPRFEDLLADPDALATQELEAGSELRNFIGDALGLTPDNPEAGDTGDRYTEDHPGRETIDAIAGQITDVGGDSVTVRLIPMLYVSDAEGVRAASLFAVTDDQGEEYLVDDRPVGDKASRYDDIGDFQEDNDLADGGRLYIPEPVLETLREDDDDFDIVDTKAGYPAIDAHVRTWRDYAETGADIGVAVGSIAVTAATGGAAAPWAIGAVMAWGAYRTGEQLYDLRDRGLSISPGNNRQAFNAWAGLAATVAGAGAYGSARLAVARLAANGGVATPMTRALEATRLMTGTASIGLGGYLMTSEAATLAMHGGDMSAFDLASSTLLLTLGAADMAAGAVAHRVARNGPPLDTAPLRATADDPGRVPPPARWQAAAPDLRLGGQVRLRWNTNPFETDAPQRTGRNGEGGGDGDGSDGPSIVTDPTVASIGFAFGTKSNYNRIWRAGAESIRSHSMGPIRDAVGQEAILSKRPSEYDNIGLSDMGLFPFKNQAGGQFRAPALFEAGVQTAFRDTPETPFAVNPRSARVLGEAADGDGTVVELTYSLGLREGRTYDVLPEGRREFFGANENRAGYVELPAPVTYTKLLAELKAKLPTILSSQMPGFRLGVERRQEAAFKATLPEGTIVSREFFEANQSMLGRARVRMQFVVADPADAARLASGTPSMADIRAMATDGAIDPGRIVSYLPGLRSGLRLSAIPGKPAEQVITDLTGRSRRVWAPEQSVLDVLFNQTYRIGDRALFNPDTIRNRLPSWANFGLRQAGYMPGTGNFYETIFGRKAAFASATARYTLSLATPPIGIGVPFAKTLQLPFSVSFELRGQYKRNAGETAPAVNRMDWARLTTTGEDGLPLEITVPGWLDTAIGWPRETSSVLVPKGGRASMESYLGELQAQATPVQRDGIETFRREVLPRIEDQTFLPRETLDEIAVFLDGQTRPASHLPRPEFSYLAGNRLQGPLERWYADRGAEAMPAGGTPLPLWNAERGRIASDRPASEPGASGTFRIGDTDETGGGRQSHPGRWIAAAGLVAAGSLLLTGDRPSQEAAAPDPGDTGAPEPNEPDEPAPTPGDPGTQPPGEPVEDELGPQLVVLPSDGLNLRSQPAADAPASTVLRPGSFVEETGERARDAAGNEWVPVSGYGTDGEIHQGWVLSTLVTPHADGAMGEAGRINPALEGAGLDSVIVDTGDTIRLIATTNERDVVETVMLNMDHILDPDIVFPGDTVYLPEPDPAATIQVS